MKKILILVMAALLAVGCFGMTGCAKEEKTLTMATNAAFPPYEFVGENGAYVGIDVEIAGKIAEKLGMKLTIVDTEFGSIVGGVSTGKYDIGMAGMTITEDRLKNVNFSTSYATAVQVVIVKDSFEYESFEDLYTGFDEEGNPTGVMDGVMIGVQQDTTGDIYASDDPENWGFGEDKVIRYKTGNDAVQALLSDKVTMVIIDNEPAKAFVAQNQGLKILEGAYADEQYAIAVAKNNNELLEKINKALDELTKDGTIKGIVEKYIPA